MYLLAAEIDKIQNYVFSSSQLREVVGASHLIKKFCQEDAVELYRQLFGDTMAAEWESKAVVADGGNFRIVFDGQEDALRYGRLLSVLCARSTGASLTVSEPVRYDGEDFEVANKAAHEKLRQAKQAFRGFGGTEQNPYAAYCSRCGLRMAERVTYGETVCPVCTNTMTERDGDYQLLLKDFRDKVKMNLLNIVPDAKDLISTVKLNVPSKAEEIAETYGGRGHIAYMVADGNRLGRLFGECKKVEEVIKTSKALSQAMEGSLADMAAKIICGHVAKKGGWGQYKDAELVLPLLPLIAGGDDCFVIVPASYALYAAEAFSLRFGEYMEKQTGKIVTMAAGLAFCKPNYPYYAAHRLGEELMREAKLAARYAESKNHEVSVFDFSMVEDRRRLKEESTRYVHGGPYICSCIREDVEKGLGIFSCQKLFSAYAELKGAEMPSGRLQSLRELYAEAYLYQDDKDYEAGGAWTKQADFLLKQIQRWGQKQRDALDKFLHVDGQLSWWIDAHVDEQDCYRHYLPDVIEMWEFFERGEG